MSIQFTPGVAEAVAEWAYRHVTKHAVSLSRIPLLPPIRQESGQRLRLPRRARVHQTDTLWLASPTEAQGFRELLSEGDGLRFAFVTQDGANLWQGAPSEPVRRAT